MYILVHGTKNILLERPPRSSTKFGERNQNQIGHFCFWKEFSGSNFVHTMFNSENGGVATVWKKRGFSTSFSDRDPPQEHPMTSSTMVKL